MTRRNIHGFSDDDDPVEPVPTDAVQCGARRFVCTADAAVEHVFCENWTDRQTPIAIPAAASAYCSIATFPRMYARVILLVIIITTILNILGIGINRQWRVYHPVIYYNRPTPSHPNVIGLHFLLYCFTLNLTNKNTIQINRVSSKVNKKKMF